MKTDYIDIVLLHICSNEILQQGKVIDALSEAKERGKIKFSAYSDE